MRAGFGLLPAARDDGFLRVSPKPASRSPTLVDAELFLGFRT
jgi:hypothetical protein